VAGGVGLDWGAVRGAREALDEGGSGVGSIYRPDYAEKWNRVVKEAAGARRKWLKVLFTEPPAPIKCAGAPQKIIHLTLERLAHLEP
jgi:hypothetical protein